MTNKAPHKKSRVFIAGTILICMAAGLQIAQLVDSKVNKPAQAEQTQRYQSPADRPLITDLNQKR